MLTHPTTERLRELGLIGMARALEEIRRQPDSAALGFEERLALLVDRERLERDTKRLHTRLRFAGLRVQATPEDVDYRAARDLDCALFPSLRRDLLEIVDDRYGRASTVVTSQLPVARWHEHIGNPTIADAVLDRLVHNAEPSQCQSSQAVLSQAAQGFAACSAGDRGQQAPRATLLPDARSCPSKPPDSPDDKGPSKLHQSRINDVGD